MKAHIKHHSITVIAVLVVLAIGAGIFVCSGLYNIGADDHHTKPVFNILQTLRDRSIHLRSRDLTVPDLEDQELILKGAGQYAAMCTGCHLKPGMQESEIRPGLYPQPPNLSKVHVNPKDAFWVIKHGIKMSGMPAWGTTHDDPTIWSMVAFLQKLPGLSPAQYQDIVAKAPPDEDMDMDEGGRHSHGSDASDSGHPDEPDHHGGHDPDGNNSPASALPSSIPQAPSTTVASAQQMLPVMIVSKSPSCGCCGLWVKHMQNAGFKVEVNDTDDMGSIKQRVGVPYGKGSCHTAEVGGYFIEGHVPAEDIKRLLAERPDAKGLVVPGMPVGSPGMELPDGRIQPYTVELVANDGTTSVFSHHGH